MHPWPCIKHFKPTLTDLTIQNYAGILEEKKETPPSAPLFFSEFAWLCHSLSFIIFHSNNQALNLSSSVQNYISTINFFVDFIHNIKKKTQNFTYVYIVPMNFHTEILEVISFISWSTISNINHTKETS